MFICGKFIQSVPVATASATYLAEGIEAHPFAFQGLGE